MPNAPGPAGDAGTVERKVRNRTEYRAGTFDRAAIDEAARTVELSFSSEFEVERWYGTEVLDHSPGAVRLDWIASGRAALLMDHNLRDQIGVVEMVQIGADRVGRARVRFGKSARATEIFQDVVDGIRGAVSVGYRVHRMVLEEDTPDGGRYRATDWEPYEISLVPYPADPSVGVARGQEPTNPTHLTTIVTKGKRAMPDDVTVQPTPTNPPASDTRGAGPGNGAPPVDHAAAERKRIQDLLSLGARLNMRDKAEEFAFAGRSVAEFQGWVVEQAAARNQASPIKPATEIGMSSREAANYSLFRAMQASVTKDWSRAGAEREASDAVAKALGKDARGFYVPFDVMARGMLAAEGTRAGELTTGGTAGNLVGTDHLAGSFIELLRKRALVGRLGARMLSGLVGNIDIPKMTGGALTYWLGEGANVTRSTPGFDQLPMAPKTIAGEVALTRRLVLQSSPMAESLVRSDLITAIGLGIDAAVFAGTGADGQPTGVMNTTGIGLVELGANGGAISYAKVIDLETAVAAADADLGNLAYVTNAYGRGAMKKTEVVANSGRFVWDRNEVNGYRAEASNQIPYNLTKGTHTDADLCAVLYGNWSDVVIAEWGVLDVKVDEVTLGQSGGYVLRAFQDVDVGVRHEQSFAAIKDMTR